MSIRHKEILEMVRSFLGGNSYAKWRREVEQIVLKKQHVPNSVSIVEMDKLVSEYIDKVLDNHPIQCLFDLTINWDNSVHPYSFWRATDSSWQKACKDGWIKQELLIRMCE